MFDKEYRTTFLTIKTFFHKTAFFFKYIKIKVDFMNS